MEKCYSDLDEQTAQELAQPLLWTVGDEHADELARKAATKAAEPLHDAMRRCREVDKMAAHIHQRLAAIHVEACTATGADPLPPRPSTTKTSRILEAEKTSGHCMHRRQQNGQWQCKLCGGGPGRSSLSDWLHSQPCHAVTAEDDDDKQLDKVIRLRFGTASRVDHSHHLQLTGRLLWCECCGQYADVQLKGLARPCRPPRKKGLCNIARLEKGLHPKVGKTVEWLLDEDVALEPPRVASAPPAHQRHRR